MRPFYQISLFIATLFMLITLCWQCRLMSYHKSQLYGLWVGVHIEYEPDLPIPGINDFHTDGSVTAKRFGSDAIHYNWVLNGNRLTLDTLHYDVIKCNENVLLTKRRYDFLYRRPVQAPIKKDEGELRAFLRNTSWISGDKALHFDDEKIYTFSKDTLIESRCWNIEKYNDYAFLYQTGHYIDCDKSKGRTMQITAANDDQLHLSIWNEIQKNDLIYTKQNDVVILDNLLKNKHFQRCNMYEIRQIGNTGNLYEGGGNTLKNYFYENYKVTENVSNENGFVIINFILNCAGNTGEFRVTEMNKNYEKHQLHEDVSHQLLDIAKSLRQWIPHEVEDAPRDVEIRMNFRIINGQINVIL